MRGKARPAEIIFEPNLSRCIETVAREQFRRGVQALAAGKGSEALAERSEVLRLFLEGADFKELRGRSEPHLLAGKRVRFAVFVERDAVCWRMDVL